MKEMVYKQEAVKREILHSGEYKGHRFYIVSYQTHPCCYVKTDLPDSEAYGKIVCNGGITFAGPAFKEFSVKGHYIGWDYAHGWDFSAQRMKGIVHTTEGMYEDVKNVIEQIIKLEGGRREWLNSG